MRARWKLFAESCADLDGESTTLVPSYAAGLEDVVIETPDRGQSPNGRSRWSQSTHHPSITVPNLARGCDLYVFHLRITYPCRARHEVIRLSFLRFYIPFARSPLALRLRSARSRFRSPRRPVVSQRAASIIIRISRHSRSFGRMARTSVSLPLMQIRNQRCLVAISRNVYVKIYSDIVS